MFFRKGHVHQYQGPKLIQYVKTVTDRATDRHGEMSIKKTLLQHGDEFDWTVHFGETDSVGTGPTVDHTLGTAEGHYLFIEASDQMPKQTAR